EGIAAFSSEEFEQGARYFQAAAVTYAAAWQKRATDPNVGTDYATALFYGGDIDAAVTQVTAVLAAHPAFQPAQLNLGNFSAHRGRIAEQQGDAAEAAQAYAEARRAYKKAVAIDPESAVGQQAAAALEQLSE